MQFLLSLHIDNYVIYSRPKLLLLYVKQEQLKVREEIKEQERQEENEKEENNEEGQDVEGSLEDGQG